MMSSNSTARPGPAEVCPACCASVAMSNCKLCDGSGFVPLQLVCDIFDEAARSLLSEQVDTSGASRRSPSPTSPSVAHRSRRASRARYSGNRTRRDTASSAVRPKRSQREKASDFSARARSRRRGEKRISRFSAKSPADRLYLQVRQNLS